MARPKKRGERYACGKLKADLYPPALVKQMIEAGRSRIINSAFGTPIGAMRLEGKLSDVQVSAAQHFCRFMGHYDRLVGNPSRTVKSPDYRLGRAGQGGVEDDLNEEQAEQRERASRDYNDLRTLLRAAEFSAVYHTALLNEACPWNQQGELHSGLTKLAVLFGYVHPRRVHERPTRTVTYGSFVRSLSEAAA